MESLDVYLYRLMNDLAVSGQFSRGLAIFLARTLIFIMVVLVALEAVRALRSAARGRNSEEAARDIAILFRVAVASICAVAIGMAISLAVFRARPFVTLASVNLLVSPPYTAKSFPSDHATLAFAVAVSVLVLHRKFGIALLCCAVGVALGRVLVGVHYPSDILAGALLGTACALVTAYAGHRIGDVRRVRGHLNFRK